MCTVEEWFRLERLDSRFAKINKFWLHSLPVLLYKGI